MGNPLTLVLDLVQSCSQRIMVTMLKCCRSLNRICSCFFLREMLFWFCGKGRKERGREKEEGRGRDIASSTSLSEKWRAKILQGISSIDLLSSLSLQPCPPPSPRSCILLSPPSSTPAFSLPSPLFSELPSAQEEGVRKKGGGEGEGWCSAPSSTTPALPVFVYDGVWRRRRRR